MCIAGLLLFLAQYVEGFHHTLIMPSLLIASLGSLASAIAFWIQYTNNNGRHVDGYIRATLILFLGLAICAALYWWNRRPPTSQNRTSNFLCTYKDTDRRSDQ